MRLIDADALIENKFKNPISYNAFVSLVKRQTVIEQRENGKWKTEHDLDEKMLACSSCGGRVFAKEYGRAVGTNGYRFCPYCGARMEAGDD